MSDCIHTSDIGCETNDNEKTSCAICWVFTCLVLGDAVCMCYPHNKPAQFHPVYRWWNWDSAIARNFLSGGFNSNHMPSDYFLSMMLGCSSFTHLRYPASLFFLFKKYSGNSKLLFNSILSYFLDMLISHETVSCTRVGLCLLSVWCPRPAVPVPGRDLVNVYWVNAWINEWMRVLWYIGTLADILFIGLWMRHNSIDMLGKFKKGSYP